jgi:hypothetical protein
MSLGIARFTIADWQFARFVFVLSVLVNSALNSQVADFRSLPIGNRQSAIKNVPGGLR